jgi:oxygen-independent coproporphyrinogen-3 oxidase
VADFEGRHRLAREVLRLAPTPGQPGLACLRPGLPSVSLYIHIPFCAAKCLYCDFCSFPDVPARQIQRVLDEIHRQLERFVRILRPAAVSSVYVGGGTPSLLSPDQISALLRSVQGLGPGPRADPAPEWTVEANPESLTEEWLAACRDNGVNRLSLGVQSLHDPLLAALGRRASAAQARQALALLDREWPHTLSTDLLAGIPGQGARQLERDIREVTAGGCAHVSLYTLTPPSRSPLRVDRDAADRLWLGGRRLLERLGYRNYEISNFARPGEECRHNLGYWRLDPYLGVGPAAVGTLAARGGGPLRLSNPAALTRYLEGEAGSWGLEIERIAPRDFLLENLMMGLRLQEGINEGVFRRRFGTGLPELLPELWRRWRREKLVAGQGGAYALTDAGRLRLNPLLVEASEALEFLDPQLPLCWP